MSDTRVDVPPLVVLDDDPTGTQTLTHARVLWAWDAELVRALAAPAVRSLHLLTNARALVPDAAEEVTAQAAGAARRALGPARSVMRGDSTLRGHVLEEYRGWLRGTGGEAGPLVLVPALPSAGRVTVAGTQLLERDGRRVPLHATEYATDPAFAYDDAELLRWLERRSRGRFPARLGTVVELAALRASGGLAVADAVERARGTCGIVVDAETDADLDLVAEGLRQAPPTAVRCAPTLVGALAGNAAGAPIDPPAGGRGVLVVCGSWVPLTTRQLAALDRRRPGRVVEVDIAALAGERPASEITRATDACRSLLADGRLAILVTPRELHATLATQGERERLARRLALVVREVGDAATALVAKGGITSAVTIDVGLEATWAEVEGPIARGVALWRAGDGPHAGMPYAVVPGNVGDDALLADVVDALLRRG